jgi:hypothetical protein
VPATTLSLYANNPRRLGDQLAGLSWLASC